MNTTAAVAKIDITPPLTMQGSYRLSASGCAAGVHDPLYARILLLGDADVCWCLIVLDLMGLWTEQADRWRNRIARRTGIDRERITLACTHTHNGPDLANEWEMYDHDWESLLIERLAKTMGEAEQRRVPVRLGWGSTPYDKAVNRHQHRKREGPNPIDPEVSVLRIDNAEDSEPVGHLVHFTAHPTTAMGVDELLSADYPGVLLDRTERACGGTGLFVQGAAGNVNLEMGERSYERMIVHGEALAGVAIQAWKRAREASDDEPPRPAEKVFKAHPRDDFADPAAFRAERDRLDSAIRAFRADHPGQRTPRHLWNTLRMTRWVAEARDYFADKPELPVPVQHLRVAGRSLLAVPSEWFVEYGLRLKQDLPQFRPLWLGYANGMHGYVPTTEAWGETDTYMRYACRTVNALTRGEGDRLYRGIKDWLNAGP